MNIKQTHKTLKQTHKWVCKRGLEQQCPEILDQSREHLRYPGRRLLGSRMMGLRSHSTKGSGSHSVPGPVLLDPGRFGWHSGHPLRAHSAVLGHAYVSAQMPTFL